MRTSRGQVETLYSSRLTSGDVDTIDVEKWQWDVLHNWWTDDNRRETLERLNPNHTSWTSATSGPPSWLSEPFLYTLEDDDPNLNFEFQQTTPEDLGY